MCAAVHHTSKHCKHFPVFTMNKQQSQQNNQDQSNAAFFSRAMFNPSQGMALPMGSMSHPEGKLVQHQAQLRTGGAYAAHTSRKLHMQQAVGMMRITQTEHPNNGKTTLPTQHKFK